MTSKTKERFKQRVRDLTGRSRGRSFDDVMVELRKYLVGWRGYFRIATTSSVFEDLDQWIRRRLRCLLIKQQRRHGERWWELSKAGNFDIPVRFFDDAGLPRLSERDPNEANRRMRPRMSGGVGGVRR